MPRNGKKKSTSSGPKRGHASGNTLGSSGAIMRTRFRTVLLEKASPIGTVAHDPMQVTIPANLKGLYSRFRIHRVGIELNPLTYLEWIVRSKDFPGIDTRQELVRQTDSRIFRNLEGMAKIFWYVPVEPVFKGWQDIGAGLGDCGLWFIRDGQNDLIEGSDGLIGSLIFDVSLGGLTV